MEQEEERCERNFQQNARERQKQWEGGNLDVYEWTIKGVNMEIMYEVSEAGFMMLWLWFA